MQTGSCCSCCWCSSLLLLVHSCIVTFFVFGYLWKEEKCWSRQDEQALLPSQNQPWPLEHAHSHNDYEQPAVSLHRSNMNMNTALTLTSSR